VAAKASGGDRAGMRRAMGGLSMNRTAKFRRRLRAALAAAAMATMAGGAQAQSMSAAALATYGGADRAQQLAQGAKKEGALTVYSSLTTDDMAHIIPAFQKKYGVKVSFWRGSSEDIRDRAIAEARNRRHDVDVIETAGPDMVAINREKLLEPVASPIDSQLIADARIAGQDWTASRITVVIGAYNTNEIKDPPKTYEDLTNPRYKGDLAVEAAADWWLMALADAWGEKKAVDLFTTMVARNGVSPRKGHTLLANLTASGEVPIAITTYSYKVDQLAQQGAPIARINWDPTVADRTGIGVVAKAPHPYAALLFRDFFLTEGQRILAGLDAVSVNRAYLKLPPGVHLKYVDPVQWVDQDMKWSALYRTLFIAKAH
jgi:iron(III) transport system substrate-binding protein